MRLGRRAGVGGFATRGAELALWVKVAPAAIGLLLLLFLLAAIGGAYLESSRADCLDPDAAGEGAEMDGLPARAQRFVAGYLAAAERFRLGPRGPAILAAVHSVETDFGRLADVTSSAGAIGDFQYRSELSFFLWLCAIARNRLRMHARRLGRRPPATSLSAFSSSSQALAVLAGSRSPAGVLSRHEEVQLLAAGMAQLSPRRRRALMLRYLDEMENDEAALAMGMSVGAFRVLLSRALVDLREELLIIAPEEPA